MYTVQLRINSDQGLTVYGLNTSSFQYTTECSNQATTSHTVHGILSMVVTASTMWVHVYAFNCTELSIHPMHVPVIYSGCYGRIAIMDVCQLALGQLDEAALVNLMKMQSVLLSRP